MGPIDRGTSSKRQTSQTVTRNVGSSVSVVVAEIQQSIEEQALATCTRTISLDYATLTTLLPLYTSRTFITTGLTRQNADIQFTNEIEENGKNHF